ncbi:MAG: 4-(cytidine 5'-diphospho)-2-C-methyl-D-erythritol kinase [Gemmatimonadota bacterium]|jgi:4-diphosphocytidyl-2-C-methyl-D-erythritol kinase|nr:4-(cytidine 5'-diphospho)-2-C-methyl-D-erythritol kinase [Gemmatimonadota bacterium]
MTRVTITPVAKVNLRLVVLAREDSGYHSLETVFCAISLNDRLEITRAGDGIELMVTGTVHVGPTEDNLVHRAALAFHEALGTAPAISIRLEKVIPSAAGLGGGSSDAAATLRALNALSGDPLSSGKLLELGAQLGSDVPFFLGASPFALAWGRGERLLQLPPPPSRPVLVVDAGIRLPTGPAFAALDEARAASAPGTTPSTTPLTVDAADLSSWEALSAIAHNDFELVARRQIPGYNSFLELLRKHGARISLLSGSGSAIFGVFDSAEAVRQCQRAFAAIGVGSYPASTLDHWPAPVLRD